MNDDDLTLQIAGLAAERADVRQELDAARGENARLRGVLKLYADPRNWSGSDELGLFKWLGDGEEGPYMARQVLAISTDRE